MWDAMVLGDHCRASPRAGAVSVATVAVPGAGGPHPRSLPPRPPVWPCDWRADVPPELVGVHPLNRACSLFGSLACTNLSLHLRAMAAYARRHPGTD